MAVIMTDNEFREAARWWLANAATFTGPPFVDAGARRILDEGAGNTDITPDAATLESALDKANAEIIGLGQTAAVQDGAETQAAAIPGWATWDEATALAWIDTNLPDDNTRTAIRAMARLLVALRNQTWPGLQE